MENMHACPYCGRTVEREEILFWETVKTQYTDNVRGEFLRNHGVDVPPGNKFNRLYYKAGPNNIIREDDNYPTMIEDNPGSALTPEDLAKSGRAKEKDSFDDDFDSDGYEEEYDRGRERRDRELRRIPKRACPHCHCELPEEFGTLKTYHVAMFGGRAAGKTAYLVNLFQQLKTQLSASDLGSVELAAESENFLEPMIEDYEREGTTRATPADGGLLPILFRYQNKGKEAFVTIYDIAGEGTSDSAYMANHRGIADCETLILMVDPNMFVGGAYYIGWTANHQTGEDRYSGGRDLECCSEPLDTFLSHAGKYCREYSDNIKNVICVLTKVDMLLEAESKLFSSGDIEIISDAKGKHEGAVDMTVLGRVSENLGRYLNAQQHVDLKEKVKQTFGSDIRVSVLGVSTSTRVRTTDGTIRFEARPSATDSKHRIIEPFLVMLMYFGLLPARMKDGRVRFFNAGDEEEKTQTAPPPPEQKKKGLFGRMFGGKDK